MNVEHLIQQNKLINNQKAIISCLTYLCIFCENTKKLIKFYYRNRIYLEICYVSNFCFVRWKLPKYFIFWIWLCELWVHALCDVNKKWQTILTCFDSIKQLECSGLCKILSNVSLIQICHINRVAKMWAELLQIITRCFIIINSNGIFYRIYLFVYLFACKSIIYKNLYAKNFPIIYSK